MKKIYLIAASVMAAYFALTMFVFPQVYQGVTVVHPRPALEVSLSAKQITLGESFEIEVTAYNNGDAADLQTVTIAFPQSNDLENIKVVSYDFLQSPRMIQKGQEVGSEYTAGQRTIITKYPFIEAYSRPSKNGDTFKMTLQITPKEAGVFKIYAKSVAMPHVDDQSHFPTHGLQDQQNEFVQEYSVEVVRQ
ncbi:MAG TPA: hypothetical protein VNK44_00810 [Candidatus Nitrosotenuis sp.]|nr:hypothetical protein [Candidatus Nitrosotenuis sp.]